MAPSSDRFTHCEAATQRGRCPRYAVDWFEGVGLCLMHARLLDVSWERDGAIVLYDDRVLYWNAVFLEYRVAPVGGVPHLSVGFDWPIDDDTDADDSD